MMKYSGLLVFVLALATCLQLFLNCTQMCVIPMSNYFVPMMVLQIL